MTTITDARAREFWCAVFLQSMANNAAKMHGERIADAADDADVALVYFANRFGDAGLRVAVAELGL